MFLARLLAATAAAITFTSSHGAALDTAVRVGEGEKRTVGDYSWAAGTVCFSIRREDGTAGTVKMWMMGLTDVERRVYVGRACFQVMGFGRIRAGFAEDGPVTIRVIHDTIAALPLLGRVR